MRVRIMNWLLALGGFTALMAFADPAAAQCGPVCPPPPPPCCQPPPPPPPPPSCCELPPPPACCGGGGNLNVNVNVSADAAARAGLNARAGGAVFVGGGGSAYVTVDQPYPTTISGLNVEGAVRKVIRVPYEARRRWEKRVVIRAFCIDDRNVPHPASQVRPDREVDGSYEGELYRCLAGTWLQITWAEYQGDAEFGNGETMDCRKGEALWHGRGGQIECKRQRDERDCNERSLLRRYGAGVKILTWVREETYTEYREEVVEEGGVLLSGAMITLDGGVGGRVF